MGWPVKSVQGQWFCCQIGMFAWQLQTLALAVLVVAGLLLLLWLPLSICNDRTPQLTLVQWTTLEPAVVGCTAAAAAIGKAALSCDFLAFQSLVPLFSCCLPA